MLKSTPWRRCLIFTTVSLLFGCNTVPFSTAERVETEIPSVPSPALPTEPADTPLPDLGGSVEVATLQPLTTTSNRIELRLLLVSPTENDAGLAALAALCDQIGVPYETFIATREPLTETRLLNENGDGRYQAVFLTDNQLVYNDGTYKSAFDADEWNLLWRYERDFAVRQVSLYPYPGSYPEDYGVRVAGYKNTNDTVATKTLTTTSSKIAGLRRRWA